ncbi:MAG: PP2C family protein-serine/threonine phosphatase, partial [Spirochaetota bacterium]
GAISRRLPADTGGPRIFGVADGVGGANSGEIASRKAAVGVLRGLEALGPETDPRELPRRLSALAEEVHADILSQASGSRRHDGMATTLSALIVYRRELTLLHAGDSRVYRLRNGALQQLSRDHTVRAMTNNPAIPGNILANCFGVSSGFFIDVNSVGRVDDFDDLYLICSDGLSDLLEHEEMERIMVMEEGLPIIAERLIALANAAGGRDNITLVLARADSNGS